MPRKPLGFDVVRDPSVLVRMSHSRDAPMGGTNRCLPVPEGQHQDKDMATTEARSLVKGLWLIGSVGVVVQGST
jgi:hypothetical protein